MNLFCSGPNQFAKVISKLVTKRHRVYGERNIELLAELQKKKKDSHTCIYDAFVSHPKSSKI